MGATIDQQQTGPSSRHAQPGTAASGATPNRSHLPGGWWAQLSGVNQRRLLAAAVVLPVAGLLVVAAGVGLKDLGAPDQPLIYYTVTRGDLPITVTERGNLESQENINVMCEVDDIHGDGIHGTTILWIVPNGSSVKEGDLLVELDRASHQERLDRQILDVERARALQIQAKAKYENQITQNETAEANARLKVELAKLELEMFQDTEKGTHRLEVEAIKRVIEDVDNMILAAQADLELKKNDMEGIEQLFKLGYAGKSELDRSRLSYLQAESTYAAKINKLSTELATLGKKENYERRMQLLTLEGAVKTAERNLAQALKDNEANLEQAKAAMEAADEGFLKEDELLTRYRYALDKCMIYAPADGMVAYAAPESRYSADIREGSAVRPRQKIITLPSLDKMQVKTSVHESVLDRIRCDLPATIRVDAFQQRPYQGSVKSVSVLPDRGGWVSSDTKVYETIVTIDEEVEQLKPGMSAVVEIHIDRLQDVLCLPVQAIVQIEKDTWCYVDVDGRTQRRMIELGRTNDKFVEIRSGLSEGDAVVLNPMAILDDAQQAEPELSPDEESPESPSEEQEQVRPPVDPEGRVKDPSLEGDNMAAPGERSPSDAEPRENRRFPPEQGRRPPAASGDNRGRPSGPDRS